MDIEQLNKIKKQNKILKAIFAVLILIIICLSINWIWYYNYSNSSYFDPCNSMHITRNEVEEFNSQFATYEGVQTGTRLKSMCGTLIANANTYGDNDIQKIIKIVLKDNNGKILYQDSRLNKDVDKKDSSILKKSGSIFLNIIKYGRYYTEYRIYEKYEDDLENLDEFDFKEYVENVSKIRDNLENKLNYIVEFEYKDNYTHALDTIIITEN